ncbi:MAG: hypothetical protein ACLUEQ_08885 [Cloacibacillus evryensis]
MFGTVSRGDGAGAFISYHSLGFDNCAALFVALAVIVIMAAWPKRLAEKVPSSLAAIAIATLLSLLCGFDVATVGDILRSLVSEARLRFRG